MADPSSTLEASRPPTEQGTLGAPRAADLAAGRSLPYVPALDGLRGLAVAAVLLYHGQLLIGDQWVFRGGYLGVSTFFTLSGFLITSLLLTEHERTGHIDGRRFWGRRFRRLLPAAWVTLAAVVVYGSGVLGFIGFDAAPDQVRSLRLDVLGALGQVANWRFLVDGQSYGELFDSPSLVLHFWSLAIEEQFYLLFPLFAMGVLALAKGSRRAFGGAIATLTALSLVAAVAFDWSHDRIYFGTDTRASELLLGALLAVCIANRPWTPSPAARRAIAVLGGAALFITALLWTTIGQSTDWLYEGGLTLYAVGTVAVIFAALQPSGAVPAVLATRPLVALGRISYGVYLYHWLVYQWLDQDTVGLGPWPLFAVRVTVTIALAAVSYRYLEQPIRLRQRFSDRRTLRLVPLGAVALVVALVAVTVEPPAPAIDFAAAQKRLASAAVDPPANDPAPVNVADPPPPRIAMFGDSTALMTGLGLDAWMTETGLAVSAGGKVQLGCGVGRGGDRRTTPFDAEAIADECNAWATSWGAVIEAHAPDLALVEVGPWEVADRKLPGDDTWRVPGDPIYDDFLRDEMVHAIDVLSADGATVVWLTPPVIGPGANGDEITKRGNAADPNRMMRINQLMREAAQLRPDDAVVVDLASWVQESGDDIRLRPDGVHFSFETAIEVAGDWLGPELLEVYEDVYRAEHG